MECVRMSIKQYIRKQTESHCERNLCKWRKGVKNFIDKQSSSCQAFEEPS